jgi:CheY-like chemotaxis protein
MIEDLKILVVDDDPDIVEVLKTYLIDRGYDVDTRYNGREALDALRDTEYDLLISDGEMAEIDGFELIRLVRINHPDIAMILMTGFEIDYPLSEALKAGAEGYITKPFSLKKFSLIFEQAFWYALSREDWWNRHAAS